MLSDPRLFNYLLIALNAAAGLRWAWQGDGWMAFYWAAATSLNIALTVRP